MDQERQEKLEDVSAAIGEVIAEAFYDSDPLNFGAEAVKSNIDAYNEGAYLAGLLIFMGSFVMHDAIKTGLSDASDQEITDEMVETVLEFMQRNPKIQFIK